MSAAKLTTYDEVLYPALVYPQTHPDRLATIGTLLGMTPAPVEHCRVLELACGDGANVISMALNLPESEFVGVDLARIPIAKGRETINTLGLKNVELHHLNLMALPGNFSKFDYILAHGLYSWVPEAIRDHILSICRSLLSSQGIAYISYNAYPGFHLRAIVRDMMLFHSKDVTNAAEKIAQSRGVIKWVAEGQKHENSYATFLSETNTRLQKRSDGSLYHDELSETNSPFYFHQFIANASQHGLQFLAEADYYESSADSGFTDEVIQQLDQLGTESILAREQYLDFLKGRSFRQTLLCHNEVRVSRPIDLERINSLLVRSQLRPESSAPDIKSSKIEVFCGKKDSQATTSLPLAKAAFVYLGKIYPRAISFPQLGDEALKLVGIEENNDRQTLASVLVRTYEIGLVELLTHEPSFKVNPGNLPVASPLARFQAQQGDVVTTLLHSSLKLEDNIALQLLLLLDGTRDRSDLVLELSRIIQSDRNLPELQKQSMLEELPTRLEEKLAELGELGLLLK